MNHRKVVKQGTQAEETNLDDAMYEIVKYLDRCSVPIKDRKLWDGERLYYSKVRKQGKKE